jgi:pantothenate kinase
MDIGGTLAKLCVFEMAGYPTEVTQYIRAHSTFGQTGIKNSDLTIHSTSCGGTIYFITFETERMEGAIELIRSLNLHDGISSMYATGGGAHKYAPLFQEGLGIELRQKDELHTVVRGLQFVVNELDDAVYTLHNVKFSSSGSEKLSVERVPVSLRSGVFPFVLCNIGSGVSIVQVNGSKPDQIKRIDGTALGGSTFFGLCRLLTQAKDFSESLDLADEGDGSKVNLLVRDIYGGN